MAYQIPDQERDIKYARLWRNRELEFLYISFSMLIDELKAIGMDETDLSWETLKWYEKEHVHKLAKEFNCQVVYQNDKITLRINEDTAGIIGSNQLRELKNEDMSAAEYLSICLRNLISYLDDSFDTPCLILWDTCLLDKKHREKLEEIASNLGCVLTYRDDRLIVKREASKERENNDR
jgi:hypothetical protein